MTYRNFMGKNGTLYKKVTFSLFTSTLTSEMTTVCSLCIYSWVNYFRKVEVDVKAFILKDFIV